MQTKQKEIKKRTMALSLAAVLILTVFVFFSACGKKQEHTGLQDKNGEYRYQPSFQTVDLGLGEISGIIGKYDEKVYLYGRRLEKKGIFLVSCKMNGSSLKRTKLKLTGKQEEILKAELDKEGQIRLLTRQSSYDRGTGREQERYLVSTIGKKGKVKTTVELERDKDMAADDFFITPNGIVFLEDKVYAAVNTKIYAFDKEGKIDRVYKSGGGYINWLVFLGKGKLCSYASLKGKEAVREFDPETGTFGEPVYMEDYHIYNISPVSAKEEDRIYLNDGKNLYAVCMDSGRMEIELNWLNCGFSGEDIISYLPLGDGKFFVISTGGDHNTQEGIREFIRLEKREVSEEKEKKKLIYATVTGDNEKNIKEQDILSFNKEQDTYYIEVRDYSVYHDPAGQFTLDIADGNIPDILNLSGIEKERMAKKGLFTDLYPWMEQDEKVKKEDFIPSVMRVLEVDGKLFSMPGRFGIEILIAGKEVVGDIEGWTVDEMMALYGKMPEKSTFINASRKRFIEDMLVQQIIACIDWESNEMAFPTDNVIKLIELSGSFPDSEDVSLETSDAAYALIKQGKLFLFPQTLYEPAELINFSRLYKEQGGYGILSYPSEDGNNKLSMFPYSEQLAITEQCKEKEGAWEFVRRFLTYEYQKSYSDGIPTRQDVLKKEMEAAQAEKAYTDEDGIEIQPLVAMDYGRAVNKKETALLASMIERIGNCYGNSAVWQAITKIVNEEIAAFYAEDKTAKEAAEIMENRVKIYVSENF